MQEIIQQQRREAKVVETTLLSNDVMDETTNPMVEVNPELLRLMNILRIKNENEAYRIEMIADFNEYKHDYDEELKRCSTSKEWETRVEQILTAAMGFTRTAMNPTWSDTFHLIHHMVLIEKIHALEKQIIILKHEEK